MTTKSFGLAVAPICSGTGLLTVAYSLPIFMLNDIRWLAPLPQPILEALIAYALTREFYQEVGHRQEYDRYCEWYQKTAAANQREFAKMQADINLLGWFNQRFYR